VNLCRSKQSPKFGCDGLLVQHVTCVLQLDVCELIAVPKRGLKGRSSIACSDQANTGQACQMQMFSGRRDRPSSKCIALHAKVTCMCVHACRWQVDAATWVKKMHADRGDVKVGVSFLKMQDACLTCKHHVSKALKLQLRVLNALCQGVQWV